MTPDEDSTHAVSEDSGSGPVSAGETEAVGEKVDETANEETTTPAAADLKEAEEEAAQADTKETVDSEETAGDDISPLFSLPRELLCHIFTFLPLEDRMRARVNQILSEVESSSKYYLETVSVQEPSTTTISKPMRKCPLECIERIADRTTAQWFEIMMPGSDKSIIKSSVKYSIFSPMCFSRVTLKFRGSFVGQEFMKDEPLLVDELSKKGDFLDFGSFLTVDQIHQIYKNILDGSMRVRHLMIRGIPTETRLAFLDLIGITFVNREVRWDRDIQVHRTAYSKTHDRFDVFADRLQIVFDDDTRSNFDYGLSVILHPTEQSKAEAVEVAQKDSTFRNNL